MGAYHAKLIEMMGLDVLASPTVVGRVWGRLADCRR